MRVCDIRSSLSGRGNLLAKLKVQVSNAHDTYLANYNTILDTDLAQCQPGCEKETTTELEESHLYMSVIAASEFFSDIGVRIDKELIIQRVCNEGYEYYTLYPYSHVWECMEKLSDIDFFIATLSLIINVEEYRALGRFYKNAVVRLIRDIGLSDIYCSLTKRHTVFIAMWFDSSMRDARSKIEKAVRECGYTPLLIDQKEHNNQIVPEIFHEIKESAFIIADLTGQRNGVYYEAGYAEALEKTVILTCRNDNEKLHFDVAQKNTIFWDDIEDLYERLLARIKATCNIY